MLSKYTIYMICTYVLKLYILITAKSGPSNGRLFQYPDFNTIVANKSFFQVYLIIIIYLFMNLVLIIFKYLG